jgi:methylmalonyl-CoA/ethylmalonyl-CoA epimerase
MIVDHIGVAVSSLQQGIRDWETLFGYRQISPVVENTRQKVRVVFLAKDSSVPVKLMEPSSPDSPIAQFARKGGGLHHLCFRCDDLDAAVPSLKQAGARFLVSPQPGEAFHNHNIAFCLTPGNLNIELIDTNEKVLFPGPGQSL